VEAHLSRPGWLQVLYNRPLLTLMLGHFTVDCFGGTLPVLYPLLISRFDLDLKTVGLVTLAYSGMASISQPLFGALADRYGTRRIGLTLIWTALTFALIGWAPSFGLLLLCAGAAGLGSGAFHPFGALSARAVIPDGQRNTAMSVYVTGGTLGVAMGPLIGISLFGVLGMRGLTLLALPGLLVAGWLLRQLRALPLRPAPQTPAAPTRRAVRPRHLVAVVGTMMAYTWVLYSIEAFVPTWYESLGYEAAFYGPLATMLILASAVGAVAAGTLADRWGRRTVAVGSLLLVIPAILLFTQFVGPIAFVTVALLGLSTAAIGPLMLVTGQQLMGGRAGLASGLILGLGFITGAIGVPITGAIADAIGIVGALRCQIVVAIAAIGLALMLPSEAELRQTA
jgi:MFS transporter, FSR family, fosmidomycin resistance protein